MTVPVTYYCPHCGTFVALERDGALADKSVTPYPLAGWKYVDPTEPFEDGAADGIRFVCGESAGVDWNPAPATGSRQPGVMDTTVEDGEDGEDEENGEDGEDEEDEEDEENGEDGEDEEDEEDEEVREDGEDEDRDKDDTDTSNSAATGCGNPFYLSFVRFERGQEIEPRPPTEHVDIDPDPRPSGPRGPDGPRGPGGP